MQISKNVKSNSYGEDAKKILAKYGLEYQNMGLQHAIESAKHAKDYLYKAKYNKETLGTGATYKGIDDVCDKMKLYLVATETKETSIMVWWGNIKSAMKGEVSGRQLVWQRA